MRQVKMIRARQVRFACIRSQPEGRVYRGFRCAESCRSPINTGEVKGVVRISELAVRGEEGGVACQGLG
jgi:hypothetical protein